MEIRILRDGIEIGPFPEETVRTLLAEGNVAITDFAWRPGMEDWAPLANLLYGSPAPRPGTPPPTVAPALEGGPLPPVTGEPATAKQKALLTYLAIPFSPDIAREAASFLINESMEDARHAKQLARWNTERLKLHPDLFAAEIQAAKEQRARHFFEVCENEGAPYFTKVTKAHCQVLVGYLDVHHPGWDADERGAAEHYFYPAIAEKFPQLLTREAKGRFKYPEGSRGAREMAQRSPVAGKKARRTSPIAALARGVFFGVLILVMLWFAWGIVNAPRRTAPSAPPTEPSLAMQTPPVIPGIPAEPPPPLLPDPVTPSPVVADPPPAPAAPPDSLMADVPTEPTPTAPTPSSAPEHVITPTDLPPLTAPPPMPGAMLTLTKPVEFRGRFGTIKLPAGMRVKLLQHNGASLKVETAGREVAVIPSSSTNIDGASAPATATPAPSPPAPVAPPTPAADSLFGPAPAQP